ncbi:MAG TPA: Na+/H+ antiporter subunit E [Candidatus Avanaerovorax faecigallinarum]|nr:Na+/H+ antiporter subunit E [Candidatus Avanaerovorax faecigallinarum]
MAKRWICMSALLFFLWVILSGKFEAKFIISGAVCSMVVAALCLPIMRVKKGERSYFVVSVNPLKLFVYFLWLVKEIFFSAIDVCRAILSNKHISPQLVRFRCSFENPSATVMLVNSIILTPGTVTVDVSDDDEFLVHALTDGAAEGLLEGEMMRRIARLYGEDPKGVKR